MNVYRIVLRLSPENTHNPTQQMEFALVDDSTDDVLQVGSCPRVLSKHAFAHDADEVRHDYDLRLADR